MTSTVKIDFLFPDCIHKHVMSRVSEALHEVLIHFCLLRAISYGRQVVFLLLDSEDVWNRFY